VIYFGKKNETNSAENAVFARSYMPQAKTSRLFMRQTAFIGYIYFSSGIDGNVFIPTWA
jgi:hypothetical protein